MTKATSKAIELLSNAYDYQLYEDRTHALRYIRSDLLVSVRATIENENDASDAVAMINNILDELIILSDAYGNFEKALRQWNRGLADDRAFTNKIKETILDNVYKYYKDKGDADYLKTQDAEMTFGFNINRAYDMHKDDFSKYFKKPKSNTDYALDVYNFLVYMRGQIFSNTVDATSQEFQSLLYLYKELKAKSSGLDTFIKTAIKNKLDETVIFEKNEAKKTFNVFIFYVISSFVIANIFTSSLVAIIIAALIALIQLPKLFNINKIKTFNMMQGNEFITYKTLFDYAQQIKNAGMKVSTRLYNICTMLPEHQ